MDLTRHKKGDVLEVRLSGRLDAYWSDSVSSAIEESIQQGDRIIELDFSEVNYLSSAGIRVLLRFYKQLKSIQGSLSVVRPSESVLSILELTGFQSLLVPGTVSPEPGETAPEPRRLQTEFATFTLYDLASETPVTAVVSGAPEKFAHGYGPEDYFPIEFPENSFGIGLGAIGNDFEDCKDRFGEFIAACGGAAFLPADGTDVPDFMVTQGALVPEIKALYAIQGAGEFGWLARFETRQETHRAATLSQLVNTALDIAGSPSVAIIMVAESAGLIGAALRKSPAGAISAASPFSFPEVREWLSCTAERAFQKSLCVVVGIASRDADSAAAPFLRPLGKQSNAAGHFHAAVFPYRPLQRGEIGLVATVQGLFASESIQGILHLLADEREIQGAGESEFIRGACWIAPLAAINHSTAPSRETAP